MATRNFSLVDFLQKAPFGGPTSFYKLPGAHEEGFWFGPTDSSLWAGENPAVLRGRGQRSSQEMLAGRSLDQFLREEYPGQAELNQLRANPDGSISIGESAWSHEGSDPLGNLVMSGLMAGVGGLSGGFGLGSLFEGAGEAAGGLAEGAFPGVIDMVAPSVGSIPASVGGMAGEQYAAAGGRSGFPSMTRPWTQTMLDAPVYDLPSTFEGSYLPGDFGEGAASFYGPESMSYEGVGFGPADGGTFTPTGELAGTRRPLMPPAIPESSEQLKAWDMTETSPGVWELPPPPGTDLTVWEQSKEFLKQGKTASEIGKILGLSPGATSALGTLGATGLGVLGSQSQTAALERLANQFAGYGAPYRSRLESLYADPSAFMESPEVRVPVDQATKSMAQAFSARGGNPFGNPAAQFEIEKSAANQLFGRLGQEKDRLGGFGGLTAYNRAAPELASAAASSGRGIYDVLGYGLGQLTNPRRSLADLLMSLT